MERKLLIIGIAAMALLGVLIVFLVTYFGLSPGQACCPKIVVSGTRSQDGFYQSIMGDYEPFASLSQINYRGWGDFPVYSHRLKEDRSQDGLAPRVSYLYFYKNTNSQINEIECPRGCWVIGMHDPSPGNFWFGKKNWFALDSAGVKCPESLAGKTFMAEDGKEDSLS
eukprot:maker-scaffold613_size124221-snap-gene-0.26 protein:Tk11734 transcript:maker-scaffold613_size124221-snap-gene-0.26-mRNA-1 annotation:"arylsulfatase"